MDRKAFTPSGCDFHGGSSQSILAWEMNYETLPLVYGSPLRLRVENQLGYKMVKWIQHIEFIASEKEVGKGYGGKNEDDEYFDLLASTQEPQYNNYC